MLDLKCPNGEYIRIKDVYRGVTKPPKHICSFNGNNSKNSGPKYLLQEMCGFNRSKCKFSAKKLFVGPIKKMINDYILVTYTCSTVKY